MMLTPRGVQRFYGIWFPLLHFVSRRTGLVPDFPSVYGEGSVSPSDAATLRDRLWADDALRAAFVAENPAGLSAEDLAVVKGWDARVRGTFYVFRQLKKHAILIPERGEPLAYAVLGLASPIEDVIPMPPPCMVEATLLPFEGKIIYDSLLVGYSISFGAGIRGSLNETYKAAQERGRLLTSLSLGESGVEGVRARNAKLLAQFVQHMARPNVNQKTLDAHRATIERFGEDYLLGLSPPRGLIDADADAVAIYLGTMGDDVNLISFKHFVRFLRDTGRMSWEGGEAMLKELL
ncbi:hypothetical protein K2Z83_08755 [Oscillochloris sp. ZM17-4]|uniref:hypothetical protein n=1 Tax=Oscillochloris sp. ZM17-4 TaxID=2866714 RepID=UPI001C73623E|nr:hypothetical protein [Oscillochloris sp. ZM17-4]MBX0327765.1 hypothetical protein [Oscillochloris sp. ZM17-4]